MYAVIFTADMRKLDDHYYATAAQMRTLAMEKYGCLEFTTCTEGDKEIAISYWQSQEQISAWKNDPAHQQAQQAGKERWYKSYRVQVVEVQREYHSQL